MASFFGFGKKKAKGQFIRSKKATLPRGFAAHGPLCLNKDSCEAEWTKGRDKAGNTYYWHAVRGIKAAYPGCGGYTMSPQGARDKHGNETTQPLPPQTRMSVGAASSVPFSHHHPLCGSAQSSA